MREKKILEDKRMANRQKKYDFINNVSYINKGLVKAIEYEMVEFEKITENYIESIRKLPLFKPLMEDILEEKIYNFFYEEIINNTITPILTNNHKKLEEESDNGRYIEEINENLILKYDNSFVDIEKYFYKEAFTKYNSLTAHEYHRLYLLINKRNYYGALLQIKDVIEVLLKLPILIIINDLWSKEEQSPGELEILQTLLKKPLALGDWKSLGNKISKFYENNKEMMTHLEIPIKILQSVLRIIFNNKEKERDIVKWRNETIGHGALSLDIEDSFLDEYKDVLIKIRNHFERCNKYYVDMKLHTEENQALEEKEKLNIVSTKEMFIKIDNRRLNLYPFILNKTVTTKGESKKIIGLFDSFFSQREEVWILDYINGSKYNEYSLLQSFKNKFKAVQVEVYEEDNLENDAIKKSVLDCLEDMTKNDLVEEPIYIYERINSFLSRNNKGIFLLEMERGMGKTTFCKMFTEGYHNKKSKMKLPESFVSKSYYINNTTNYKLGYFNDILVTSLRTLKNQETLSINFNSDFRGKKDKKLAFATLLNKFHDKYKQIEGKEKLLIVLDGLDEIADDNGSSIFDCIPNKELLNEGIYILLSSRTKEELIKEHASFVIDRLDYIEKNIADEFYKIISTDKENVQLINKYITSNINLPENIVNEIIDRGNQRFLYVKVLKELLISNKDVNFDYERLISSESIIEEYLSALKNLYGEGKQYDYVIKVLIVLAIINEPLTKEELAFLVGEENINLRLVACLFDIRGLLKIDRSNRGNLYSIHNEIVQYLKETKKEVIENIVLSWCEIVKNIVRNQNEIKNKKFEYILLISNIYDYISQYLCDESMVYVEELYNSNFVSLLVMFSVEYSGQSKYLENRLINIYNKTIEIFEKDEIKSDEEIRSYFYSLYERGKYYFNMQEYNLAYFDFQSAFNLDITLECAHRDVISIGLQWNAINYMASTISLLGYNKESLEYYNDIINIIEKLCNVNMLICGAHLVSLYSGRGRVYEEIGDLAQAIVEYTKSIERATKVMEIDKTAIDESKLADSYQRRAMAYIYQSQGTNPSLNSKSLKDINNAIVIYEKLYEENELENLYQLARTYEANAIIHTYLGNLNRSIKFFLKVEEIYTKLQERDSVELKAKEFSSLYFYIAYIYSELSKNDKQLINKAIHYLNKSLEKNGELGDLSYDEIGNRYSILAQLYMDKNLYDIVLHNAEKSIEFFNKIPNNKLEKSIERYVISQNIRALAKLSIFNMKISKIENKKEKKILSAEVKNEILKINKTITFYEKLYSEKKIEKVRVSQLYEVRSKMYLLIGDKYRADKDYKKSILIS